MSTLREDALREIGAGREWDVIVAGGGATGLGTALESVSRGYRTLLLEAEDFAKATSSRSTKLVHGGVRYLRQGNIKLVREALRERGRMLRNAPHLAHRRAFAIPAYALWELPFYGAGLSAYDVLAGSESIGRSRLLSRRGILEALPTVRKSGLKGGVLYYDGQFDDARYAVALLRTFLDLGGTALNYAPVTGLRKRNGIVAGVCADDKETGARFDCTAKVVINATGIFSDFLRRADDAQAKPAITVSQGSHFVLPRAWLPGDTALMIPRTSDGRVLFAIPWHDRIVVGTTDDPVAQPQYEPRAMPQERTFLSKHIERFLGAKLSAADVLSVWSGQRPLVREAEAENTAALSREHTVLISPSRLLTIAGGKWTTYRKMAEDAMDRAAAVAGLAHQTSRTAELRLHGWTEKTAPPGWDRVYGADLPKLNELSASEPELAAPLHPDLPFRKAEAVWAARFEMARTVEDVLARRTRALFLNARAAIEAAEETARLLARELRRDPAWEHRQVSQFRALAEGYLWTPAHSG
ncbi:MAG: glycerol-3-phosphate dehydrogenase/oxidase [Bryobacteraceae bacterium]